MNGARHCQCLLGFYRRSTELLAPYPSSVRDRKPINRSLQTYGNSESNDRGRSRVAVLDAEHVIPYDSSVPSAGRTALREGAVAHDGPSAMRRPTASRKARNTGSEENRAHIYGEIMRPASRIIRRSPAHQQIVTTLHAGEPHAIMIAAEALARNRQDMRNFPMTLWTEIFRALDPKRWTLRTSDVHRNFMINGESFVQNDIYSKRLERLISRLLDTRKHAGISLSVIEAKTLLGHAKTMRSTTLVRKVLSEMQRCSILPDTDDWNTFAITMLIEDNQRLQAMLHSRFRPLKGGKRPQIWKEGITATIRAVFQQMIKSIGNSLDTRAYCTYMLALARDGDFEAANRILREVWGLDASDAAQPLEEIDIATLEQQGTKPNNVLLTVIAEIFGAQNRIPTAYRLITELCDRYGLSVQRSVWLSLLFWTWINARIRKYEINAYNRKLREEHESESASQFFDPSEAVWQSRLITADPLQAVDELVSTIGSGGNLGGNAQMNHLHIQFLRQLNFAHSSWLGPSEESSANIRKEGQEVHAELMQAARDARRSARVFLNDHKATIKRAMGANAGSINRLTGPTSVVTARQTTLQAQTAEEYVKIWVRGVLRGVVSAEFRSKMSEQDQERVDEWQRRGIPRFIDKSLYYLPNMVSYYIDCGKVELKVPKDYAQMGRLATRQRRQILTKAEILRELPEPLRPLLSSRHRNRFESTALTEEEEESSLPTDISTAARI